MKNTLLCTTALALTGFAGAASAGEVTAGALNVGFSGYYNTGFAYADVGTGANIEAAAGIGGTDFDGVDIYTNAEIHFKPSMMLDNGIKIGIDVQLEAGSNTNGDQIDEAYMSISGDFGQVLIGSENSVGYKMTVAAPDVSMIYAQSSSLTAYVPYSGSVAGVNVGDDVFRGTLGATYIEVAGNNDAQRLSYFSPRFGGLQLGVSYARNNDEGNAPVNNNTELTDIVDLGANYSGEFGEVSIDASARYGVASATGTASDPEIWGAGLSFGFSNFTFGGSYAEQTDTASSDGSSYDLGMSYANGPMSYSLTYFKGKNIDNENPGTTNGTLPRGVWAYEELETWVLAAKYKVNSNFAVGAFIADTDFSEDFDDAGVASGGDDVDGTVLGVTASFSF